jgi:hypothetical protein
MAETVAEQLKHAIESGDFDTANVLVKQYGRAVSQEFHECATPEGKKAVVDQALAFLHDRLHLARVVRAHIASRLQAATGSSCYQSSTARYSTWRVDG